MVGNWGEGSEDLLAMVQTEARIKGGGHSGRGGHIMKNTKLRNKPKKLRPIAQNSGHVARITEVSKEILLS